MPTVSAHFRSLYSSFRGTAHSTRVVRVLPRFYSSNRRRWLRLLPAAVLGRSREPPGAAVDAGTQFHAVRPAGLSASPSVKFHGQLRSPSPPDFDRSARRDCGQRPRPTDRRTDLQGPSEPGPARPESVPFLISTTNDLWIIHSVSVGGREGERGTEQRPAPPLWRLN